MPSPSAMDAARDRFRVPVPVGGHDQVAETASREGVKACRINVPQAVLFPLRPLERTADPGPPMGRAGTTPRYRYEFLPVHSGRAFPVAASAPEADPVALPLPLSSTARAASVALRAAPCAVAATVPARLRAASVPTP